MQYKLFSYTTLCRSGGRLLAHTMARNLLLDLDGTTYLASPLVLHHQGIDLILGVDWMNQHGAVIDTDRKSTRLNLVCRLLLEKKKQKKKKHDIEIQ